MATSRTTSLLALLFVPTALFADLELRPTKEGKRRKQKVTNGPCSVWLRSTRYGKPIKSLAAFGAHFPDKKGKPVESSTMSDVLKDSAKWLPVDVSSGRKFVEYTCIGSRAMVLSPACLLLV